MFLERFKEVENFTITKLPLGGSKTIEVNNNHHKNKIELICKAKVIIKFK